MQRALRPGLLRLLTALFLLLAPGAAHAQCKPGDLLVGEDSDNYYCRNKARYEGSDAQFAGTHFCIAKRTLAADQKAIRAMGFAIDTERFEMFGNVAREQKAELEQKLFDALLDGGLEATGMMVNSAASLNPWNVNNAVNMLRSKGFGNQTVIAALRRVAAQKNKAAMATAYHQFVEVAKAAKEGWSTGSAIASDPRNAELRLLLGALKVMQGNPELGLVVTGAEVGESLAYLVYLNGRVGELSSMTDEKLSRLSTLGKRLKDHVDAMRTSRTAWRQAMGINSGDPTCRS